MIQIEKYGSSSKGNLISVDDSKTKLLLDVGFSIHEIKKKTGFSLWSFDGVLLTHEHLDHAKGAKAAVKAGLDVYSSALTFGVLKMFGHRVHCVKPLSPFKVGSWEVIAFPLQHDSAENFGYLLKSGVTKESLVYATDTCGIKYRFPGTQYWLIEANYDAVRLECNVLKGITPASLKTRLKTTHFEIRDVKEFFRANDLSRTKEIHLLHISETNGDPAHFKREIQELTGVPVYV